MTIYARGRTERGRRVTTGLIAAAGLALAASGSPTGFAADPEIVYENVFSEMGWVEPHDIVVDDGGYAYILAANPGNNYATRVMKLAPDGDTVWLQVIDGSSHDIPGGIAIDAAGDVYVVGTTGSDDFPLVNPLQDTMSSVQYEAFVLKLAGDDGTLLYSTYLGGVRSEFGNDIAVNDAGEMYIVGRTQSLDFPTVNPLQEELAGYPYYGWDDAYVAKISADGSTLLYSTFLGGYYDDEAQGIALDDDGRIHIVGETNSDDFPLMNPIQSDYAGGRDAFAACLSADGSTLEYGTYLGGEDTESVRGITLGANGRLYLDGHTQSIGFPTTPGAYQEDFVGEINGCEVPFGGVFNCSDVFVACLAPGGTSLLFSTYLGGSQTDNGYGLAVDAAGNVYATGHTRSDNFPPYATGTFYTNFVSKLDPNGGTLEYSFLHDTVTPSPAYVALDATGGIYLAATVDTFPELYFAKLQEGAAACPCDCSGGDGTVDVADILAMLAQWGVQAASCDVDGGGVGVSDFLTLLANWGPCP
jgi:hypothetical protein